MAFCPNCGTDVGDAAFCSNCGTQVNPQSAQREASQQPVPPQQPAPQYQQPASPQQPSPDTGSFGWAVLGFFFPLVGLILFLVWKDTKPLSAKRAGVGALVSVIVGAVLSLVSTCAGVMVIGMSSV